MRRDEILQEIATIDDQINKNLAGAKLPSLERNLFPWGIWITAALVYALSRFGSMIPEIGFKILNNAKYIYWAALVLAVFALLGTLSWLRKSLRRENTDNYRKATAEVKVLQERRQELVLRIKELDS